MEFIVSDTNHLSIPALIPQADLDNLRSHTSYGGIKVTGNIEYTRLPVHFVKVDYDLNFEYVPEKRVNDILKIFAYDVRNNINNADSIAHGSIQLELINNKEKKSFLLTFFSIWTLCMPSLIGVPVTSIKTELEIRASIFDSKNNFIGKYDAKGLGRSYVAMYWGYGEDAERKSNIIAFKNAMASIKTQINNDKQALIEKLTNK